MNFCFVLLHSYFRWNNFNLILYNTVYLQFPDIPEIQTTDGSLGWVSWGKLRNRSAIEINGGRAQMLSFTFFYGINLRFTIYSITDNLLKALQGETILAVESQKQQSHLLKHWKESDLQKTVMRFLIRWNQNWKTSVSLKNHLFSKECNHQTTGH